MKRPTAGAGVNTDNYGMDPRGPQDPWGYVFVFYIENGEGGSYGISRYKRAETSTLGHKLR